MLNGCVIYTDNPPEYTFHGSCFDSDTDRPVADARVHLISDREKFSLFPVDTFNIVGSSVTDLEGNFEVTGKVIWPAKIGAFKDYSHGTATIEDELSDRDNLQIKLAKQTRPSKTKGDIQTQ